MGAKTWMVVLAPKGSEPVLRGDRSLKREAAVREAHRFFPGRDLAGLYDGTLSFTCPTREVCVGCYGDATVIAAHEVAVDYPSRLQRRFVEASNERDLYLHAMHSVVDWFAYAHWTNGKLVRSLSVSPEGGVLEDIGERKAFELPFWSGAFPAVEPGSGEEYPLPFHPLELGEAALLNLFGYQLEGSADSDGFDADAVPILRFQLKRPWWRLW